MSLIPKVKCSRCDKSYSGLKLKCPYCGAHRGRGGKRAADTGDSQARFMIKMLLLLALVVTVLSMIFINFDDEGTGGTTISGGSSVTQGSGENGEVNGYPEPTSMPTPTPAPTPTPVEATSLGIRWPFWTEGAANDITIGVGTTMELWAQVFPTDTTATPRWTTSAGTIVNHTDDPNDLRNTTIEGRSVGNATITVTVGDLEASIIIRVV